MSEASFATDRAGLKADIEQCNETLSRLGEDESHAAQVERGGALWKIGEDYFRLGEFKTSALFLERAYRVLWRVEAYRAVALLAAVRHSQVLMQMGKLEAALYSVEAVLDLNVEVPEYPDLLADAHGERLYLLEKLGRTEETAETARALIRRFGTSDLISGKYVAAMALNALGRIEQARGDGELALRAFGAACRLCSVADSEELEEVYSEALIGRATCLEDRGEGEEVLRATYDEILTRFARSENEQVRARLAAAAYAKARFG
jgi:tetratricopeptide (TPR) repeat protein